MIINLDFNFDIYITYILWESCSKFKSDFNNMYFICNTNQYSAIHVKYSNYILCYNNKNLLHLVYSFIDKRILFIQNYDKIDKGLLEWFKDILHENFNNVFHYATTNDMECIDGQKYTNIQYDIFLALKRQTKICPDKETIGLNSNELENLIKEKE